MLVWIFIKKKIFHTPSQPSFFFKENIGNLLCLNIYNKCNKNLNVENFLHQKSASLKTNELRALMSRNLDGKWKFYFIVSTPRARNKLTTATIF